MDLLKHMNEALKYIENNLTNEIDYQEVAQIALCSEYHFKRMFSFLSGITLAEYIRHRRLTLAAFEVKESNVKVIDLAMKYGYTSPDSFTRAFQPSDKIYATSSDIKRKLIGLKIAPILAQAKKAVASSSVLNR